MPVLHFCLVEYRRRMLRRIRTWYAPPLLPSSPDCNKSRKTYPRPFFIVQVFKPFFPSETEKLFTLLFKLHLLLHYSTNNTLFTTLPNIGTGLYPRSNTNNTPRICQNKVKKEYFKDRNERRISQIAREGAVLVLLHFIYSC